MKKLFIAVLALSVFTTAVYASDADRAAKRALACAGDGLPQDKGLNCLGRLSLCSVA